MREYVDVRIQEHIAREFLPGVGEQRTPSVRRVVVSTDDPIFERIAGMADEYQSRGELPPFGSVTVTREYLREELDAASLLRVIPTVHYDPPAAFMGTRFDETRACPECGAGRVQLDRLVIPEKVGRKAVVACSLGQEWIVSRQVEEAAKDAELQGIEFDDVYVIGGDGSPSARWVQPRLRAAPVEVIPPTAARDGLLSPGNYFLCSAGEPTHCQAREVVSEVTLRAASWDGSDVVRSVGLYGGLRGYLRPGPLVFVSQRARAVLEASGRHGYRLEVCHLGH